MLLTHLAVLLALVFLVTPSAGAADEILVAAWERKKYEAKIIYQDGKMIWERQYDELVWRDDLIERPAQSPGERKFDREESIRPKYLTLSDMGIVRYFSWEGTRLATALTTFMDSEAMTIGSNVQVRECVPKKLSAAANELVRLYKQLHAFKDHLEFAEIGFSAGGPYNVWMRGFKSSEQDIQMEVKREIGFMAANVIMLGHDYQNVAGDVLRGRPLDPSEIEHIENNDRTIRAHLALAFCE